MKDEKTFQLSLKHSKVPAAKPELTELKEGELAINVYDKDIYAKKTDTNEVVRLNSTKFISVENDALPGETLAETMEILGGACSGIKTPDTVSPFTGAKDVGEFPALVGTAYHSEGDIPRKVRHFQVDSADGDFSSPLMEISTDSDFTEVTKALPLGQVKWRIRDEDEAGNLSDWSCPATFTSQSLVLATPELDVEGAPDEVLETPRLLGSPFTVLQGKDVHFSSDWQILKDGAVVWEKLGTTLDKTSVQVPEDALVTNTDYTVRVRYKGRSGQYTEWGEETIKTNISFLEQPIIQTPLDEDAGHFGGLDAVTPMVMPDEAIWEMSTDPYFENIIYTDTKLEDQLNWDPKVSRQYYQGHFVYARLKYKVGTRYSDWSNVVQFTLPLISIETPVVTLNEPLSELGPTPVIHSSPFRVTGGYSDTHVNTTYQILEGSKLVWEYTTSAPTTLMKVPAGVLQPDGRYTFRVKYTGHELESNFGAVSGNTKEDFLEIDFNVVAQADFLAKVEGLKAGQADSVEWEASYRPDFSTTFDSYTGTNNMTLWGADFDPIGKAGELFFVRIRYKKSEYFTEWKSVDFSINTIEVLDPTISVEGFPDAVSERPLINGGDFRLSEPTAPEDHEITLIRIINLNNNSEAFRNEIVEGSMEQFRLPEMILRPNSDYRFEISYKSELYGWSAVSSVEVITKSHFLESPVETLDIDTDWIATVTLEADKDLEALDEVEWEVSFNSDFSEPFTVYKGEDRDRFLVLDTLTEVLGNSGKLVYVRVRYRSEHNWSPYSQVTQPIPGIVTPTAEGNLNNIRGSIMDTTHSSFAANHIATDWELLDSDRNSLLSKTAYDGTELLDIDFSEYVPDLVEGATYYVKIRHHSDKYGSSEWGEREIKFVLFDIDNQIPVASGKQDNIGIGITKEGDILYCGYGDLLTLVDRDTMQVVATAPGGATDACLGEDGLMYVPSYSGSDVRVFETPSLNLVKTVSGGLASRLGSCHAAGKYIWIIPHAYGTGNPRVYDTESKTLSDFIIATSPTLNGAVAVGDKIFFGCGSTLYEADAETKTYLTYDIGRVIPTYTIILYSSLTKCLYFNITDNRLGKFNTLTKEFSEVISPAEGTLMFNSLGLGAEGGDGLLYLPGGIGIFVFDPVTETFVRTITDGKNCSGLETGADGKIYSAHRGFPGLIIG